MITPTGTILSAVDHGTVWQLFYEMDGNGLGAVNWDWRNFAHFYESVSGRSFFEDYQFGAGRDYISKQLKDRRISVEGEPFEEVVRLED